METLRGGIMIDIRTLEKYDLEDQKSLGKNGYTTNYRYVATKDETADETTIRVKLEKLEEPYVTIWPSTKEDFENYDEIIPHGYSLGAYDGDKLVGVLIVENRQWNNSLWIDEIEIADTHRGKGVGALLLNKLHDVAVKDGFRIIALEVQSTNYSAIKFYRKNGYELDGLDLSLYTNTDALDGEVAFFMKRKLL